MSFERRLLLRSEARSKKPLAEVPSVAVPVDAAPCAPVVEVLPCAPVVEAAPYRPIIEVAFWAPVVEVPPSLLPQPRLFMT